MSKKDKMVQYAETNKIAKPSVVESENKGKGQKALILSIGEQKYPSTREEKDTLKEGWMLL